jgi:hypothetical protein
MDSDDNEKVPPPVIWGLLGPIYDWSDEQRAAADPQPESNIIYLKNYQRLH